MRYVCAKSATSALTLIAATVIIMLWSATPLRAQVGGLTERDRNINDRTAEMSNLERRKAAAKRDPQEILAEVNEDFNRLRAIDEEMKTRLASNATLDYRQVAATSAEVKQHATRLKTNLTLPDPKEKRLKVEEPGADLKPALTTLEGFLNSFLTNPIFSDAGDLDARLAGKAKLDLDSILELSEKIRKSADKLSKNPGK